MATYTSTVQIPYSCDTCEMYEMMRAFIRDFIRELSKVAETGRGTPRNWEIEAMKMKYVWESKRDDNVPMNSEIADVLPVGEESVRSKLIANSRAGIGILVEDNTYIGISANTAMKQVFIQLQEIFKPVMRLPLLKEELGGCDNRTLAFFLDGLGYETSSQTRELCVKGKRSLTFANKAGNELIRYMKDDPVPHKYLAEVYRFMKEQKWDDSQCELMKAYMKADTEEFEWRTDDLGTEVVSLTWSAIDSIDGVRVRILYDFNKNNGVNAFMRLSELNTEYNRIAAIYGLKPISPTRQIHGSHVEIVGAGCYRYSAVETQEPGTNFNPQEIIPKEVKKFVAGGGGLVKFDDVRDFVHSRFNPVYSDNSVYLFANKAGCRQKTVKGVKYIYLLQINAPKPPRRGNRSGKISPKTQALIDITINALRSAPYQTMTKRDLLDAVKPHYDKAPTVIYKLFQKLKDDGLIEEIGQGKGGSYKLIISPGE